VAEIRSIGATDISLVSDIMADAFTNDPAMTWTFNGPAAIGPMMTKMATHIYVPRGFGHVTTDDTGATLWLPPGANGDVTVLQTISMGAILLRHGGLDGVTRSLKTTGYLEKKHPHQPHYYLFAIGVRTGHHGKGIGKSLVQPVLDRCDSEGMPAYLESSTAENVPIYRTMGFEVTQELQPTSDSPVMYAMWREPRG
jgi:ribosomal protein S18 acetylase RimI-like enzyme